MPKKRRRTWGSITTVTRNKHIIRWIENAPSGRLRKSKTFYGTYREADRFLAEKRIEVESPVIMTVSELWNDHERPLIQNRLDAGSMSHRTVRQYDSIWVTHVEPKWGKTPCTEVKPLDVQKWILSMSDSNGKLCRVVLKNTLEHAVMFDIIQNNPAAKKFRFSNKETTERSVYNSSQLDSLWDIVRGSVCEVPFILSAHAGLRVGEACGLPVDCVRFERGAAIIEVRSQLSDTGELRARLKTPSSLRTVALPDPWCSRLREIIQELPTCALWVNDDGSGMPVKRWAVARKWQELVKDSTIHYEPMQVLRPSYETAMHWEAGVPVEQISRIMGHRQISTTLGHYDRPSGEELVSVVLEAAEKLRKIS